MNRVITLFAVLIAIAAHPVPARAQGDAFEFRGWGPRLGITSAPDELHVGVHADLGNPTEHVRFQPNIEVGFGNDRSTAAFNGEAAYRFESRWGFWAPYAGGGLGLNLTSRSRDGMRHQRDASLGASALGGLERGLAGGDRFFIEAKLGLIESPDLKLSAGWMFH